MIVGEVITSLFKAAQDFLKGRRAEEKQNSQENQVIKILQEQLNKGEERELQLRKK